MNTIETLNEFLDMAQRNRKYAPNSVYGYRAALKLFADEVNEEEKSSMDLFKERYEQIFSNIVNKKKNIFSIASLQIYRKRVKKLLSDYEKYGVDPTKMANWTPLTTKPLGKTKSNEKPLSDVVIHPIEELSQTGNSKHEYSVRQGKKIIISYPYDFTLEEAKSIKSFADYLISMRGEDQT
ncbi:MAG: hypothetical protein ACD_13C00093G0002 [uncultured bacterium]|nr:MAG: hypothetical protein ACD_13C00093G0002 [uncultured bacterium]